MFRTIKVKLYPTLKQQIMLDNHFNAYRFCYNLCLEYKALLWGDYKIKTSGFDMQQDILSIRRDTDWLLKCKAECVRDAAMNVNNSFLNLFNGAGFPKFKSKNGKQSFTTYQTIRISNSVIKFFGYNIKYSESLKSKLELTANPVKHITFKKDSCGNYFASCLLELTDPVKLPVTDKAIGIDLGLKELAITSDGVSYANNRYLQATAFKIAKLQRRFSRTQKGSNNRNKLRIKIAKLHHKAVRQRDHYYHQITNELIRDNQTIVLETLKIKNMVKNGNLARSISDASWGRLTEMLIYKANWTGREIIRLDTFYPSTKTCSNCGNIKDMPLSERIYNCECGLSLDRDINAAINIRNAGLKIPGVSVEGVGYEPIEAESKGLILII